MKDNKLSKNADKHLFATDLIDENQSRIPEGYEVIKKYPLHPPFSYVDILYNQEKSNYLYFVDELKLNHDEVEIFQSLYRYIEESLESPSESNDVTFDQHLEAVLKE